jgi:hypothetical protein
MREREKGRTQEQAAVSANLSSRKTVSKYEKLGKLPSELTQPRQYRTRANPFEEDWPTAEQMLADAPGLEAKALFEWLCEQHPGRYRPGQLRTFQRHVSTWRALNQDRTAILEQVHRPGEVLQTDGTWLTDLGVTIQGQPFKHLLIHVVILDDLGYVQQSREEMEVLFTFLAERYERRSVVITSNLVFSEWDQIFKDPLTTAAAIDRVVHHSLIVEFGREMKSVRAEEAARRNGIRLGGSDAAQDAEK